MDFVFGFPVDSHKNTGILVYIDRFIKMMHLVAVPESIKSIGLCPGVYRHVLSPLWLPRELVSDQDPRVTAEFWRSVGNKLGTRLKMSTSGHSDTDDQIERANRVLEEILQGYVHSFTNWSEFLPMVEFAISNSVDASTTHTPFFVNGMRHPHLPTFLDCGSRLTGGELIQANASLALTHHVLTMRSPRLTPMSIISTSVGEKKSKREDDLITRIMIKSTARPVIPNTHSLRQQLILPQCTPRALYFKIAIQQMTSYWLAKELSVSYKTLL